MHRRDNHAFYDHLLWVLFIWNILFILHDRLIDMTYFQFHLWFWFDIQHKSLLISMTPIFIRILIFLFCSDHNRPTTANHTVNRTTTATWSICWCHTRPTSYHQFHSSRGSRISHQRVCRSPGRESSAVLLRSDQHATESMSTVISISNIVVNDVCIVQLPKCICPLNTGVESQYYRMYNCVLV